MIKPARGIILVEPIKDNDKTSTGVYLPEASKDKPMKGKVLAVGDGYKEYDTGADIKLFRPEIEKDDIIYYKKWGNDELKKDGKEYVFLRFEDVLGIEDGTSK